MTSCTVQRAIKRKKLSSHTSRPIGPLVNSSSIGRRVLRLTIVFILRKPLDEKKHYKRALFKFCFSKVNPVYISSSIAARLSQELNGQLTITILFSVRGMIICKQTFKIIFFKKSRDIYYF